MSGIVRSGRRSLWEQLQDPLDDDGGEYETGQGEAEADTVFCDALDRAARRWMQRHWFPPTRAHSEVALHARWKDAAFLTDWPENLMAPRPAATARLGQVESASRSGILMQDAFSPGRGQSREKML